MILSLRLPIAWATWLIACCVAAPALAADLNVLFLGDNGHHRPHERFVQLQPVLATRGIHLAYTDKMADVSRDNLRRFDALLLYANIDRIESDQEKALLDYVAEGGGFVPLHCATYCFRNSDEIVSLMGAQFERHGTGVFRTEIARPEHPVMRGFGGFSSWDETYVHRLHNEKDRVVLDYRVDEEGREPWTWVRTHGKGRVFYTAWGHDQRTWSNPGFQNLVERGIRWATGSDPATTPAYQNDIPFQRPEMTAKRTDVKPFEYVDVGAKIPNYTPGERWGVQGQPYAQMQVPLPPEESVKHYVTPVGFKMELYAAEPQLGGKPIAMNWDERGRLWVCESYDYPNELQPPGKGRDRVRVCEDTDGDGRADKFTVFAEDLSIPTAITFYRGGVIVQNGVETLYFKDTDGDDRADVRKVLISNWALGDTHGGVSNFRYGLDNWFWAMQGYNFSQPVINGVQQQGFRQGFFRFRLDENDPPRVTDIEFIRSTNNNTWGIGLSEEGIVLGSTANRNPSVYMPVANRYYERVRGWAPEQLGTIADTHLFQPITERVRQVDHHGGYTAGAGHALYTGRAYPKQWWNRTAFVCGPTGHLVGTFVLRREGADFHSTSPSNLVASDDEWSAPIAAEVGPDGNVWVLDWYNYIVQHNPTPQGFKTGKGNAYESDLRDKKHGRIYRVEYLDADETTTAFASLAGATPQQLVEALKHPTMLWRLHAQRLLVERGKQDVVPALVELAKDGSVDEIGLNVGVIHALWTLQGLDALDDSRESTRELLPAALRHPSAGVRRNAIQVLPHDAATVELLGLGREGSSQPNLLQDSDPQVRLAAQLALADMTAEHDVAGQELASLVLDSATTADRWLNDALTSAAATHAWPFLFALQEADGSSQAAVKVVQVVAQHAARGRPPADKLNRLIPSLARMNPELSDAIVSGLVSGWPNDFRIQLAEGAEESLPHVLDRLSPGGKGQLIRLATLCGSRYLEEHAAKITESLFSVVEDFEKPTADRVEAARQVVGLLPHDEESLARLLAQVTPQAEPELAEGLLEAIGESSADSLGTQLVERATAMAPSAREVAFRVLLRRPETTAALLEGIEQGTLQLTDLKLDQKQALSSHPDRRVRRQALRLLEAGGGLPNPDRQKVLAELLDVTQHTGDVAAGKEVFKKHCSKCHVHQGEGEHIGPDLTGMAVHPKAELLTQIIDPSQSVEGNFRQYTVVTAAGKILTGMLAGESRTSIELIDTEAKRHLIQREDIEELIASRKSVMPEGFEKQIARNEFTDLLELLTAKGRFVPMPLDKFATAISTKGLFHDGDGGPDRIVFSDWTPKSFDGVPFHLVDPLNKTKPNILLLHGPRGTMPPKMPEAVTLPCNMPVKAVHLLSGVSGWGYPAHQAKSVSVTVRLHYEDGETEDHELVNGVHFADYIRRVDVPGSQFAFGLGGQQLRYLSVEPKRKETIREIELRKGDDPTAPIVVAITLETASDSGPIAVKPSS